jgi:hypothetical protein
LVVNYRADAQHLPHFHQRPAGKKRRAHVFRFATGKRTGRRGSRETVPETIYGPTLRAGEGHPVARVGAERRGKGMAQKARRPEQAGLTPDLKRQLRQAAGIFKEKMLTEQERAQQELSRKRAIAGRHGAAITHGKAVIKDGVFWRVLKLKEP